MEYRLNFLQVTLRINRGKAVLKVKVKELFSQYNINKTYQHQNLLHQYTPLHMDQEMCKQYGVSSRQTTSFIDYSTEAGILLGGNEQQRLCKEY